MLFVKIIFKRNDDRSLLKEKQQKEVFHWEKETEMVNYRQWLSWPPPAQRWSAIRRWRVSLNCLVFWVLPSFTFSPVLNERIEISLEGGILSHLHRIAVSPAPLDPLQRIIDTLWSTTLSGLWKAMVPCWWNVKASTSESRLLSLHLLSPVLGVSTQIEKRNK